MSKCGNFIKVINKAKNSMESTDIVLSDHFADVCKIFEAGITSKVIDNFIEYGKVVKVMIDL